MRTLNLERENWSRTFVEWTNGRTAYISVVFSWDLQKAWQRAVWLRQEGYKVKVGGPAAMMQKQMFDGLAEVGGTTDALQRHHPEATMTSRGCIRDCEFCVVPKVEGDIRELNHWEPKRLVLDNNLLACSKRHFDRVIDSLKLIKHVDFNQGLDARLLTDHHAQRIAELDMVCVRLAWDDVTLEGEFRKAFDHLLTAGFKPTRIFVYVIIGYKDSPDDALYRLQAVRDLGGYPNPMRYQPLKAKRRNSFVGKNWTNRELGRYMRYWANFFHTGSIPFAEFV